MMSAYPFRLGTNRSNPYTEPGGLRQAENRGSPRGLRQLPVHAQSDSRAPPPNANLNTEEAEGIVEFVFGAPDNVNAAPPCDPQAPLGRLVDQPGLFPQLQPLP